MVIRHWVGERMRRFADVIDHAGAPKSVGLSFTFERGQGIMVVRETRDHGCQLWYLGDREYERAHTEAEDPT